MANMSYCRFQNTYSDFADCVNALHEVDEEEKELSPSEKNYSKKLYELAQEYIETYESIQEKEDTNFFFSRLRS